MLSQKSPKKSVKTTQENIELKNTLKEKNYTIKGLKHDLEYLDNHITDDMISTVEKVIKIIKNIKRGINCYQIRNENNE